MGVLTKKQINDFAAATWKCSIGPNAPVFNAQGGTLSYDQKTGRWMLNNGYLPAPPTQKDWEMKEQEVTLKWLDEQIAANPDDPMFQTMKEGVERQAQELKMLQVQVVELQQKAQYTSQSHNQ